MYKLSRAHKDVVKQFMSVTDASENVGIAFCRHFNWDLQVSINEFFSNPNCISVPESKKRDKVDKKKIKEMFEKYKEADHDVIAGDGLIRFFGDLGLDPTDIMTLFISWTLDTSVPCEISKAEFLDGFERLGFDSIAKIKSGFSMMTPPSNDWERFKDFYMFCFTFNLVDGQKGMDRDIAIQTWELILQGRWNHLNDWLEFIRENYKKSVPRDTWAMLHEFIRNVGQDFSGYSENDAWPVLIDEFVEWMKERGKV